MMADPRRQLYLPDSPPRRLHDRPLRIDRQRDALWNMPHQRLYHADRRIGSQSHGNEPAAETVEIDARAPIAGHLVVDTDRAAIGGEMPARPEASLHQRIGGILGIFWKQIVVGPLALGPT